MPALFVITVFAKKTKGSLAQAIARRKLSQMCVDALLRTAFAARLVKLYWILEMIVPPMELMEYVVELLIVLLPMPTYVMPAPKIVYSTTMTLVWFRLPPTTGIPSLAAQMFRGSVLIDALDPS